MARKQILIWSAAGVGTALLLVAAFALIAPGLIDWNQYRERITALAADATGRAVTIGGDISFQLLPQPAVSAGDVSIANVAHGRADRFAHLDALDIEIALFPLLAGDIAVRRIVLDGPDIALEHYEDGRNNWTFEGAVGRDGEAGAGPRGGRDIRLDRFAVRNGRLTVTDVANNQSAIVTDVDASLTAASLSGPFTLRGRLTYNGVPLAIEAETGVLETGHRSRLGAVVRVAGGDSQISYNGSIQRLTEGAVWKGRLRGRTRDAAALLATVDRLVGRTTNESYPGADQAIRLDLDVEASPESISVKSRSVRLGEAGGRLSLEGTFGAVPKFDVTASMTTFDLGAWLAAETIDEDSAGSPPSESAPPFSLPTVLAGTLSLSAEAVSYRGGLMRQVDIAAGLEDGAITVDKATALMPGGTDMALAGRLKAVDGKPDWAGRIDVTAANLRAMLTWLGLDVSDIADSQLAGFSLSADMTASPTALVLSGLEGQLDLSHFTGAFRLGFTPATVVAALDVDRLNLSSYMATTQPTEPMSWADIRTMVEDGLAAFADRQGEIDMTIGQLGLDGITVGDTRVDARLNTDKLEVARLSAGDFAGGSLFLSGDFSDLASQPRFDGRVDLAFEDTREFLRWSGIETGLATGKLGRIATSGTVVGTFDAITIDLNGAGLGGRFGVAGDVTGLAGVPERMNLTVSLKHPSQAALFDRLGWSLMQGGRDAPLDIGLRLAGRLAAMDVTASGEILGGEARIDGQLNVDDSGAVTGYSLAIDARHPEVVDLLRVFDPGYRPSRDRLGPATLVTNAQSSDDVTTFTDIRVLFGPTSASGRAALRWENKRPTLIAEGELGTLPVDAFLPPRDTGVVPARVRPDQRWSKEQFATESFRAFDADMTLTAERITYGPYRIDGANLVATLADGLLSLEGLSGQIFGGQTQLLGQFDARQTPTLTLDIDVEGGQLAQLLQAVAGIRPMTGELGMSASFTGSGSSQYDIVRSLSGTVRMNAIDGTISGIDLPRLSGQMREISSPGDFVSLLGTALTSGGTPYSVLATELACQGGVLRMTDLASDLSGASLSVDGRIDLAEWTMNGAGQFTLKEHPNAPPIGFDLTGNLGDPKVQFRTQQLRRHMFDRLTGNVLKKLVGDGQSEGLSDLTGDGGEGTAGQAQQGGAVEQAPPAPNKDREQADKVIEGLLDVVRRLKGREDEQAGESEKKADEPPN